MTPTLPPHAALLLDLDGTLLDFAPTPDSVIVPDSLRHSLALLRQHLDDALAIITGRPIEQIDALLGPLPFAVAGEHGGAIRHAPDAPIERPPLADLPPHWRTAAQAATDPHPGTMVEHKPHSLVMHYRNAPTAGPALRAALEHLLVGHHDDFAILTANMAWELKPIGADKGTAVHALMSRPPFAGRTPVFIGDDTTDEDAITAARALGGAGWRVDESFGSPAAVRLWLERTAGEV